MQNSYNNDPNKIPLVIIYCASRLRAATIATANEPNERRRTRMQRSLFSELQFALSFIGMAAAIGHACNIPIILRNLAAYFYRHASSNLPVAFDLGSLLALDAGCDSDDIARPVASYHLDWWTQDTSQLLSFDTLDTCLQHFQELTGLSEVIPPPLKKPGYTWSRHLGTLSDGLLPACTNCKLYRAVALGVLDDLQDLRHLAHGLEVTADSQLRNARREAGGFFQLYEAALLKGLQEADVPQASQSDGQLIPPDAVLMPSAIPPDSRPLRHESMPRPSHLHTSPPNPKWTPGPTLTKSEVLNVFRPPNNVLPPAHSGYNISLPPGPRHDDSSIALSPAMGINVFDIPEFLHHRVPSLEPDQFPTHFHFPPLRNFQEDDPVPTTRISALAVCAPPDLLMPVGQAILSLPGESDPNKGIAHGRASRPNNGIVQARLSRRVVEPGQAETRAPAVMSAFHEADPTSAFSDFASDSSRDEAPNAEEAAAAVTFSDLGAHSGMMRKPDTEEADPAVAFSDLACDSSMDNNSEADEADPAVAFSDLASDSSMDNNRHPDKAEEADPAFAFSDLASDEHRDADEADPAVAFSDLASNSTTDDYHEAEEADPVTAFSDLPSPSHMDGNRDSESEEGAPEPVISSFRETNPIMVTSPILSDSGPGDNPDADEADPVAAFTDISSPIPSDIQPDAHSADGHSSDSSDPGSLSGPYTKDDFAHFSLGHLDDDEDVSGDGD